ncbi:hypothetical protein ElyMa_001865600 [Elysia marginata]|uniref:Uncharacterized protein n=1 Tax=Elysia marginata TaxID=1093978 RepID=A0AAV4EMC2_9GAST|nr:hypothetical protein ElyMa_001865600 [Elysia marginata]
MTSGNQNFKKRAIRSKHVCHWSNPQAGCMTLLALVVMGVKGHDHLTALKMDDREVLRLLATGVDILGQFYVGWSFVVALISALVTLSSFMCCMVEVVHVSEISD